MCASSKRKYCAECGESIVASAKYCPSCGAPQKKFEANNEYIEKDDSASERDYHRAVNEIHESKYERPPKKNNKVKGIGGWLLFYVIWMCVSLIIIVVNSGSGITNSDCDFLNEIYGGFCNGIKESISVENFMTAVRFVALIISIILILSKKKVAIKYNLFLLLAFGLWVIIDTSWVVSIIGQYDIPSNVSGSMVGEAVGSALGSVAFCCIWAPYFLKSERVKNTLTQ